MSPSQASTTKHNVFPGYIYIASAAFCWGISATIGRAAFTGQLLPGAKSLQSIDLVTFSQARITFAFLVFLPVLLITRGWKRLLIPRTDLWKMGLLGILGVAFSNYLYYLAIQRTNIATAIIVQYTAPIWVLLYMVIRGLQTATWPRVLAVIMAVGGIALVIGIFGTGGFQQDKLGILAALLAAFVFAFYNIGGHSILERYDRWIVLLYITFSASLFWMVVNPPWKIVASHYSAGQWLFMLIFSLISVLAPFSFYIAGLSYLEPTRAVIVSCLEPVFSIAIAALILGEGLRSLQLVGMTLVLGAIVVAQLPDASPEKPILAEPIE